jgi:hypothetical protein
MMTPLFMLLFGLLPQRAVVPANQPPAQTATSLSCQSQLFWINPNQRIYSLGSTFQINLFSSVGSGCTPGELRVSAVFIDHNDEIVCSGVVENVAIVDANTQSIFLEFKPLVPLEFVRWRNGLRPPQPIAKRLICIGPDQLTEVSRIETDRAAQVRIFVTLLPRNGGVSNVDINIDPRRLSN